MTGMLQRREIDIGGTGTFFIPQRIGVVDYIQLYTHTRACFIFRQPLLSTVSNIFTLPFQRSVWIAIAVFLLLLLVLLCFSTKWEYRRGASANTARYWQQFNPAEQTVSDNLMVVLGAIAQQGNLSRYGRLCVYVTHRQILLFFVSGSDGENLMVEVTNKVTSMSCFDNLFKI